MAIPFTVIILNIHSNCCKYGSISSLSGEYAPVSICSIPNDSQNDLNSFAINWLPLSDKFFSERQKS